MKCRNLNSSPVFLSPIAVTLFAFAACGRPEMLVAKGDGGFASGGAFGGTGGATSGVACTDLPVCGGSVLGTWSVTSSCLELSGPVNLSMFGLDCPGASVVGSLQVTGTWIANADSTYTDNTNTTGHTQYYLPPPCHNLIGGAAVRCASIPDVFSNLGNSALACTAATDGGCTCTGTVNHMGNAGLALINPQTNGTHKTIGNVLVLDNHTRYGFCVSGDQMSITPQTTWVTTKGAIVLQQ